MNEPTKPLSPERLVKITKAIESVANAYCRRVWWADKLELQQEAWQHVLPALARKEAQLGGELPLDRLGGFVYLTARRVVSHFCWSLSSPVTASRGSKRLAGLRKVDVVDQQSAPAAYSPGYRVDVVDAAVSIEAAREELYWRVAELYASALERTGSRARGLLFEAVMRVLVDGTPSGVSAAELECNTEELYLETAKVKRMIKDDATSCEILEELQAWRAQESALQ